MQIKQILIDSLKYPLSDWKKILTLGIIILAIGVTGSYEYLGVTNAVVIWFLLIAGFIIGLLVNGYLFRILKSSLDDLPELPKFDNWIEMFKDGVSVFLVGVVYFLPIILIMLYLIIVFSENFMFGSLELNSLVIDIFQSLIDRFLLSLGSSLPFFLALKSEILIYSVMGFFGTIYLIIVTPLFLMTLANMANYYDGLISAFRFREILDEIKCIGWMNLMKWYVMVMIIYFIISSPLTFLLLFNIELVYNIVWVLFSVVILPYTYIFFARAVALIYISE